MVKIDTNLIRKLKDETGAPVMRVKKVLEELNGNEVKAKEILYKEGFEKAEKREGRTTSQGIVTSYVHHSGKIASLVSLMCETDFVARNELFTTLGKELAMQIASMNPKDKDELLSQPFIKDADKTVGDLIKEVIAKTGENIQIGEIVRVELGK